MPWLASRVHPKSPVFHQSLGLNQTVLIVCGSVIGVLNLQSSRQYIFFALKLLLTFFSPIHHRVAGL